MDRKLFVFKLLVCLVLIALALSPTAEAAFGLASTRTFRLDAPSRRSPSVATSLGDVKERVRMKVAISAAAKEPSDEDEFVALSSDDEAAKNQPPTEKTAANSTNEVGLATTNGVSLEEASTSSGMDPYTKNRKLELMFCNGGSCEDLMRVSVGNHNDMEFEGPATGQVAYVWDDDEHCETDIDAAVASVLFFIRPNDDELMNVAAQAVRELTADNIQVLLSPDMAAKLKHYYNVDDEMIRLFEPQLVPGYGDRHHQSHNGEENVLTDATTPDLICTLGGDGMLMHASLMFPGPCPPILCVAGGSLGFLTPFKKDEMVEAIKVSLGTVMHGEDGYIQGLLCDSDHPDGVKAYETLTQHDAYLMGEESSSSGEVNGNVEVDDSRPRHKFGIGNLIQLSMRMRLDCRIITREGVVQARFNVLNEVCIDRGNSPYLSALECFCDNVHLTTVQADGVIFATPTGSTAYSMAAGGSVVHPAVPAILVTPICPHVLSFRSMVFPDSVVLRCYVPDDARSSASVAFDGRYRRELNRGDSVQIQMCSHPVPTINRVDHSSDWLSGLKRSFNFNSRPRQRPL